MEALRLALADKEVEIIQLKKRLHEEESENQQLREQLNDVLAERSEAPTTVTIFAAPPDLRLMHQIEETRKSIASLQEILAQDSHKRVEELQEQIHSLQSKLEKSASPVENAFDTATCFNSATTKIIHLAKAPPMSPQVAASIPPSHVVNCTSHVLTPLNSFSNSTPPPNPATKQHQNCNNN